MKTEEEEPVTNEVPTIKEEEQESSSVVEEAAQQVVNTEENSNVAINYSQQNNQLVYQNDGTYIEYAYQVEIRAQTTHLVHVDKTPVPGRK